MNAIISGIDLFTPAPRLVTDRMVDAPQQDSSDEVCKAPSTPRGAAEQAMPRRLDPEVEALVREAEGGDVGAPFEPRAIAALRSLRDQDHAGWVRVRARLKAAGVGVSDLDKQLRGDSSLETEDVSTTDKLVGLARRRCTFVHDPNGEPYAVFEAAGARQVLHLDSKAFGDFLSHAFYLDHERAPNEPALRVALSTLNGQAKFEGEQREVFVRVARTGGAYWLDLCDDAWQCIRITSTGWSIVAGEGAPLFTRSASMRPLPIPKPGGTLDKLWSLVNIPQGDQLMVLTWMLECLRPDTPHVVLELIGEQGSAKSSTQRALRRLLDPNQADLRAAPKSVDDVWIAARNSHMVSLENLSHLQPQYQDALCVLATGGGFSARKLYTNVEETIIELRKPIVLNGISVIVTAQDLLDRCLHIDLPAIQSRELAGDIEQRFEAARPELLAALLDQFVAVLALLPTVVIAPEKRPRMADFAALGEAVFRINGKGDGEFLARYNAMRKDGVHRTIDASPVGAALLAYLSEVPLGWEGTLTDLLDRLERYRPHGESWPRSAKGLGDALRRLAPALRLIGIDCRSMPKTGGVIRWELRPAKTSGEPCPASPANPEPTIGDADQGGHPGHPGLGSDNYSPKKNTGQSDERDAEEF